MRSLVEKTALAPLVYFVQAVQHCMVNDVPFIIQSVQSVALSRQLFATP